MTKKNITLFMVFVLLSFWNISSIAQQSHYGSADNPYPFGPTETGPILYDQMWNAGNGWLNSTEYTDAANLDKTSETADDFDVPTGETWTIGKAAFAGWYGYLSAGGASTVNVRIYADDNGMPGTELHSFMNVTPSYSEEAYSGSYMSSYWEVTFATVVTLTDGKYWISFQVVCDYALNGDWGWADATNNPWIGEKLHWRNPLNGWGWGYTTWTPGDLVMMFGYFDRAFALYEPSVNDDLAARSLVSPASAPGLTSSETIVMQFKNEGTVAQTGFDVAYIINGGTPLVENVGSLVVNPEEVVDYSFTSTADFSGTGIYDIQLVTMLSGDQYSDNDTAIGQVVNYGTVYVMQDGVNITTCEGTFTDPGGLYANFNNSDKATMTIYPAAAGHMVRLNFLEFDVTWSDFSIFDGENISAPLLGYWQDDDNPGVVTAMNPTGALTIDFEAPSWDNAFGWVALITCYDQPDDDFAIMDFTRSTYTVFTGFEFEFSATVRNIGAIAQSKDVSFYVDGTLIGTVNTGMVNPTEYATVTLAHTITNPGNVTCEVHIPVDDGDDPDNDHAEMNFDVYLVDTFVEFFEESTFPPTFWSVPGNSAWLWQTAQGFPYEGMGAAQCYVPWGGFDTLISPQLTINYGDYISLYLKTSLWWPGKMKIIWQDANTGAWSEIETLAPTMNYDNYMVDVSAAAGNNFIAFVPLCDDPWSWGGELTMDNVLGIGPMLYFVDHDLTAYNLQGTTTPVVNSPTTFDVTVRNIGALDVSSGAYSVKLMQVDEAGDIELTSVNGQTINHLQEITYTLNYTFQASGEYDVYAKVVYGPDMIPENDITINKHLYVQVSGTIEVKVGTEDDESYWIPMRTGSTYSLSQTVYPESMINQTGAVTGMSFFYDNGNYAAVTDIPVKVWIGTTNNPAVLSWIPATDLTLVFDDSVDFEMGYHELYMPLSVPLNYTGGNIVTLVYKYDAGGYNSTVDFKVSAVTDSLSAWATSYYYINPELPDSATTMHKELEIPVTSFFINTAGFGELSGTVYDENSDPFPGVDVTIDGTTVTSVTNQNGEYFFNEILGGAQSITASVFEYEDTTQSLNIQAGIVNFLDFTMVPKPRVEISGTVVGNDDPQNFLEGALVDFNGYANFQTTTDENGEFLFPWVYGNETYSITISLNGWEIYYDNNVVVTDVDLDLGTIELIELMSIPFSVFAAPESGQASINWMIPNTGVIEDYSYELFLNQGYANEPYEHVWLGNIYETTDRGTITSVDLYWRDYMTNSGEVTLDILDENGKVVMSSEPFMTVKDAWVNVDIPDVYFNSTFYAMVHWQENPETTDFLACEISEPGQHGPNLGYIMYPGDEPYLVSTIIGDHCTFEIVVNAVIEDDTRANGRAIDSYNIYSGPLSDALNASSWIALNTEPIADTFYIDTEWPPAAADEYVYAVETIYTTGESVLSFSNLVSSFAPVFVSTPVTVAYPNIEYIYNIVVEDPNPGDIIEITGDLIPAWLTLVDNGDGTAVLSGITSTVTNFDVILRASDGTNDVTQEFTITIMVGIEELNADEVKVYPNPARNMLYIKNSVQGTAVIYSATGQRIGEYQLNQQLNSINVSSFESGLYLMKIVGNNNVVTTLKFFKD